MRARPYTSSTSSAGSANRNSRPLGRTTASSSTTTSAAPTSGGRMTEWMMSTARKMSRRQDSRRLPHHHSSTDNGNNNNQSDSAHHHSPLDSKAKRRFKVQVPKRMMYYMSAVFLILPLFLFAYEETHLPGDDETNGAHAVVHKGKDKWVTWMDEEPAIGAFGNRTSEQLGNNTYVTMTQNASNHVEGDPLLLYHQNSSQTSNDTTMTSMVDTILDSIKKSVGMGEDDQAEGLEDVEDELPDVVVATPPTDASGVVDDEGDGDDDIDDDGDDGMHDDGGADETDQTPQTGTTEIQEEHVVTTSAETDAADANKEDPLNDLVEEAGETDPGPDPGDPDRETESLVLDNATITDATEDVAQDENQGQFDDDTVTKDRQELGDDDTQDDDDGTNTQEHDGQLEENHTGTEERQLDDDGGDAVESDVPDPITDDDGQS